jgi:hypothetical protein
MAVGCQKAGGRLTETNRSCPALRQSRLWRQASSTTQSVMGRIRGEQAAIGVVPPDQGLGADGAAVGEAHERLVVELELVPPGRVPEPPRQGELAAGVAVARAVELEAVAAGVLRGVERDVRMLHERLARVGVIGVDARADTGGDHELDVAQHDRLDQRVAHLLRDPPGGGAHVGMRLAARGAGVAAAGHEDQELVAALARDHVAGPGDAAQAPGHLLQELVADGVAEVVVDELEVVEVEVEDGGRSAVAVGGRDRRRQVLLEQRAVGQVGERVVVGEVGEPVLGLLARGHVEDDSVEELDLARRVEDAAAALVHPPHRPIGVDDPVLDDERVAALDRLADAVLHQLAVFGMDDTRERAHAAADELGGRVAGDGLDLVAQELHGPVAVGRAAVDGPGHVGDECLEAVRVPHRVAGEVGIMHRPGVRPGMVRGQHPKRGSRRGGDRGDGSSQRFFRSFSGSLQTARASCPYSPNPRGRG